MLSQQAPNRSITSYIDVLLDTIVAESPASQCPTVQIEADIELGIQSGKSISHL